MSARVLVVDDEAGVRAIVRETLKRAGFQVATACNGVEALGLIVDDATFDAVLLDLAMPHMDGVEAFRLIRLRQPELPIVLTSGCSPHDAAGRMGHEDLARFVQKPFMPAVLVQTMLDAVGQRRQPM